MYHSVIKFSLFLQFVQEFVVVIDFRNFDMLYKKHYFLTFEMIEEFLKFVSICLKIVKLKVFYVLMFQVVFVHVRPLHSIIFNENEVMLLCLFKSLSSRFCYYRANSKPCRIRACGTCAASSSSPVLKFECGPLPVLHPKEPSEKTL